MAMTGATVAASAKVPAGVEAAGVSDAVEATIAEVMIVEVVMKTATDKSAEANAAVIWPSIVPVGSVPGRIVVRYGQDTACCRRRRCTSGGRSADRGGRWRHPRDRRIFYGRGGVRRCQGVGSSRRGARRGIVAVSRDRLIRATGKLRGDHRGGWSKEITYHRYYVERRRGRNSHNFIK
jgi:hypothetical protein